MALLILSPAQIWSQIERVTFDTHPMHWGRFWARAVADRNLIWTPIWNCGKVSDCGLAPEINMRWPGSNGRDYLYQGVFYVCALVRDMRALEDKIIPEVWEGKEFPILNSSSFWVRGGGRTQYISKDDTHQQTWQPIPGFFNHGQYGWIWGIDEDTNGDGEFSPDEDINYNGMHDRNLNPPESIINSLAISTDKRTWPEFWPGGSYIGDDRPFYGRPPRTIAAGTRKGRWNGEYKAAPIADQETLYRMDDHENDFVNAETVNRYWPMKKEDGTPDTTPWAEGGIAGAGIEVEARTYAWCHPLAEDILISIYRLRNYSDYNLNHVIAGMWANANIGRADYNAADFIVASYEIERRESFDILYQWQKFPNEIEGYRKIGTFAFAFLESPGIAYNGLDDDKDGLFDEAMDDGIDNDGDWKPFSDSGLDRLLPGDAGYKGPDEDGTEGNGIWDTEDTNRNGGLDPGEDLNKNSQLDMEPVNDDRGADGIGPDENGWPGPDHGETNGYMELGEPNFDLTDIDEADQAGLKHVHVYETNRELGDRIDGFYNKYLSDRLGEQEVTESDEDICFTFGARGVQLARLEWKRFAIALIMGEDQNDAINNKEIMQEIYDNNYSFLTPPIQPTLVSNVGDGVVQLYWDSAAESSKDPYFGEDFNGYRLYKSTDPKFLDIKKISDAFGNVLLFKPLAIYDKEDGLKGAHPITFPVVGGQYNMGNDSGLRHAYRDTVVDNGRKYFYALTAIDAGNDHDFFERKLVQYEHPMPAMPSESPFNITVNLLGEVIYRDRNTAVCIPVEAAAGYTEAYVDSLEVEHIGPARGGSYAIRVYNKEHVNPGHRYQVTFNDDGWLTNRTKEYAWGSTTGTRCINLTTGDTLFDFQYENSYDFVKEGYPELERLVAEGLHFGFRWPVSYSAAVADQKKIKIITYNARGRQTLEWQRWLTPTHSNIIIKSIDLSDLIIPLPGDFELRVYDGFNADTSVNTGAGHIRNHALNFAVYDITDQKNERKMRIMVNYDSDKTHSGGNPPEMYGQIWDSTRVTIMFEDISGTLRSSWSLRFFKNEFSQHEEVIPPAPGDIFRFYTERNPCHLDTLRFTVEGGDWSAGQAREELRDIFVVPDPYVVSNSLESIYELAGATQRRVDFVNLPPTCRISIFTASGKLVRSLQHNSPQDFGRESYDLTTDDGTEIAFGIYFYVVEAEGIGIQRGKFAVIK